MNDLVNFIKEEVNNKYKKDITSACLKDNIWKLHLTENDKSAVIKKIDISLGKEEEYSNTIAIRIPEIQKTKQKIQLFLRNRNNICDYIIFIPKDKIAVLVELKGTKMNGAKKQISLGFSFLQYILSIYCEEKKECNPKKIIRLIIQKNKNGTSYTDPNKYYQKNGKDIIFCQVGEKNPCLKKIMEI